ncbi:MAG: hypothetical protein LBM98_03955 [Oscillospiraceae bacterium]|nr:hypothetical protein [Oscillospiraceae bacterium]
MSRAARDVGFGICERSIYVECKKLYSNGKDSRARHCEVPVSSRYVGRYRHEAIQCRECNIRLTYLRIVNYYVNPGLLRRISSLRIASAVAASQ